MRKKPISPVGDDWDDLRAELFSPEEIAECDVKVAIIGEIINARQSSGLTQKQLEALSGVRQPVIARLERGSTDPQLSTLIRVLAPLGKTLAVVPLDQETHQPAR
jgi:DNA-binding XRE family transcriptional regulator